MDYVLTQRARHDLKRFDIPTQRKIIEKVHFYLSAPEPLRFAKTLTDSPYGTYRFRILGKIRVIFIHEPEEGRIVLTRIRFRKETY